MNLRYTLRNYEEFFEDVWDYVSHIIVNDDMWEKYRDEFSEITYDLYHIYKSTSKPLVISDLHSERSREDEIFRWNEEDNQRIKLNARIIESFVKNLSKILVSS